MDPSIKAGIFGFLLAFAINFVSPVYLDFVPSFLAAILAIYAFRVGTFKDGLVVAFMTYVFNDGVLGTIELAALYLVNEPYPSISIDIWTVFSPIVSALTAVIAGYVGARLAQKRKSATDLLQLPAT